MLNFTPVLDRTFVLHKQSINAMNTFVIINALGQVWSVKSEINNNCPFFGDGQDAIVFYDKKFAENEFKFYDLNGCLVAEFDVKNKIVISQ